MEEKTDLYEFLCTKQKNYIKQIHGFVLNELHRILEYLHIQGKHNAEKKLLYELITQHDVWERYKTQYRRTQNVDKQKYLKELFSPDLIKYLKELSLPVKYILSSEERSYETYDHVKFIIAWLHNLYHFQKAIKESYIPNDVLSSRNSMKPTTMTEPYGAGSDRKAIQIAKNLIKQLIRLGRKTILYGQTHCYTK